MDVAYKRVGGENPGLKPGDVVAYGILAENFSPPNSGLGRPVSRFTRKSVLRPRAPKKRPGGTQSYDYVHFSSFDPALFHRRVITASESRGFEMQAMQAIKATFKAME